MLPKQISGTRGIMNHQESIENLKLLIEKQADDDGLWFDSICASEAYLQLELRRLHGLCEKVIKTNAIANTGSYPMDRGVK